MKYTIKAANGNSREAETRADAESIKNDMEELGLECEIIAPGESEPEVVEEPIEDGGEVATVEADELPDRGANIDEEPSLPDDLPVETDPLSILPGYMIEEVQGKPTLNKRGLSVLAFHYGIDVTERNIIVSPHESDWEYAIVETTVMNDEGKTFVGTGTAHLDRGDDKGVLLEMAETRSYKRAVSFATGTGIVSYQEMVGELE